MLYVIRVSLRLMIAVISVVSVGSFFAEPAHAAKLNLSPPSAVLTEGQSQEVTLTIDEPIICEVIDETCTVIITLTSGNGDRVTISGGPITIPFSLWSQSFPFTVLATDDQADNGDVSTSVNLTVQSNSEYYNGFSATFPLSILDNDSPEEIASQLVAVQNQATGNEPRLPATGYNTKLLLIGPFVLIPGSSLTLLLHKKFSK